LALALRGGGNVGGVSGRAVAVNRLLAMRLDAPARARNPTQAEEQQNADQGAEHRRPVGGETLKGRGASEKAERFRGLDEQRAENGPRERTDTAAAAATTAAAAPATPRRRWCRRVVGLRESVGWRRRHDEARPRRREPVRVRDRVRHGCG